VSLGEVCFLFFRRNVLAENPSNNFPCSMDGKRGKPSVLITGPHPGGIKRVELVTNNKHEKLTFGSRPIEVTLGVVKCVSLICFVII
jgi:hypothetical protein